MQHSAQAAWNLAWMHENGVGIDRDYHLAWRYYMMAWDISPESYLPVRLSLSRLYLRDWWNKWTGGRVNPIQPEPGKFINLPRCPFLKPDLGTRNESQAYLERVVHELLGGGPSVLSWRRA